MSTWDHTKIIHSKQHPIFHLLNFLTTLLFTLTCQHRISGAISPGMRRIERRKSCLHQKFIYIFPLFAVIWTNTAADVVIDMILAFSIRFSLLPRCLLSDERVCNFPFIKQHADVINFPQATLFSFRSGSNESNDSYSYVLKMKIFLNIGMFFKATYPRMMIIMCEIFISIMRMRKLSHWRMLVAADFYLFVRLPK